MLWQELSAATLCGGQKKKKKQQQQNQAALHERSVPKLKAPL